MKSEKFKIQITSNLYYSLFIFHFSFILELLKYRDPLRSIWVCGKQA